MHNNEWRKATASHPQNSCVEVRVGTDDVLVRDSKNGGGPQLRFNTVAFESLLATVDR